MTWMLATVTGPEEAETAAAAGVDIIDVTGVGTGSLGVPDPQALRDAMCAIAGRCRVSASAGILPADPSQALKAVQAVAASGADFVRVGLEPAAETEAAVRALRDLASKTGLVAVVFADRGGDFGAIDLLAGAGFAGAMLDTAEKSGARLLDHLAPPQLVRFVALCRAKGLLAGLAGGLEAADVPRLLTLAPDFLGFRSALCHGHDRAAALDAGALAAIRRLIPAHREAEALPAAQKARAARAPLAFDRIFVRDLVLEVSIGAYRHERDRPQRVRFEVVAEVPRRSPDSADAADDIGEVFSYDVILDTIAALVEDRHINLVETLAEEVAARLLEHSQLAAVTVRVEKLDVAPAVVGVEIVRYAR